MNCRALRKKTQHKERWSVATGLSIISRGAGGIIPLESRVIPMGDSQIIRGHHFVRRWLKRRVGWVPTDWHHRGYVGGW